MTTSLFIFRVNWRECQKEVESFENKIEKLNALEPRAWLNVCKIADLFSLCHTNPFLSNGDQENVDNA